MGNVAGLNVVWNAKNKFLLIMEQPITQEIARECQETDYPIAFHRFYGFRCLERKDGLFEASWYCDAKITQHLEDFDDELEESS